MTVVFLIIAWLVGILLAMPCFYLSIQFAEKREWDYVKPVGDRLRREITRCLEMSLYFSLLWPVLLPVLGFLWSAWGIGKIIIWISEKIADILYKMENKHDAE